MPRPRRPDVPNVGRIRNFRFQIHFGPGLDRRNTFGIWHEVGILSGTLARLQRYKSDRRRRVLNDALLFATARKHGCSVLTRNVLDFDFLQQLDPSGKVLFYR
jgi:predicted nucleic acid-binding protein